MLTEFVLWIARHGEIDRAIARALAVFQLKLATIGEGFRRAAGTARSRLRWPWRCGARGIELLGLHRWRCAYSRRRGSRILRSPGRGAGLAAAYRPRAAHSPAHRSRR